MENYIEHIEKMFGKIEIRKIEIPSPIKSLKIGDDFNGSKIKTIYKEVVYWNDIPNKIPKNNEGGGITVCMQLEDDQILLLGQFIYKKINKNRIIKFDICNVIKKDLIANNIIF